MKAFALGLVQRLGLVLAAAAAAAACSGDSQVVLELSGVADVSRVEILLLEPVVQAKEQRHNALLPDTTGTLETVYYMEERMRLDVDLTAFRDEQGKTRDPVQIEVRGAGGAYVPFVMGWSGTELRALGVYDPTRIFAAKLGVEHGPAAVEPVGDVTIFPVALEPATSRLPATDSPQIVKPSQVMEVRCPSGGANSGALSGYVWRLGDGHELRVLVPLPGASGERGRLDPADLDCDQHSPGRAQVARGSVGDALDCDDAASSIHGGAREQCNLVDDDCNPETREALTVCAPGTCNGAMYCSCKDGTPAADCLVPIGLSCALPVMVSGLDRVACDSAGELALPRCVGGCEVMLAWSPSSLDVKISDAEGLQAYGLGAWAPITDGKAYLTVRGGKVIPMESLMGIVVHIRAEGGLISDHVIRLDRSDTTCGSSNELVCK